MIALDLFDPGPPTDGDAPRPGSNGASADDHTSGNLTRSPPTPRAGHNAPAGTFGVAADRIVGDATDLRARVLAFIVEQGSHGATDNEAGAVLQIKLKAPMPRRDEPVALRLVVDSGHRPNRGSGRPTAVWVESDDAPKRESGAP